MVLNQYFKVMVSSPKLQKGEKVIQHDLTPSVFTGLSVMDEDGKIQEAKFDLSDGYIWLDVLAAGMNVDITAGNLNTQEVIFSGFIQSLEPEFGDDGDLSIQVVCSSSVAKKLSNSLKNLVYPSSNHPETWGRREILASEVIFKLAEKAGYTRGTTRVKRDVLFTQKKPVSQNKKSDWAFINTLAERIHCVVWVDAVDGIERIHLVDEEEQVNTIAATTFFYASRKNGGGDILYIDSGRAIQMDSVRVNLDTSKGKKGAITSQVNPKTGKDELVTEQLNKNGEWQKWVLDEDKLQKLSPEERQNLIDLFSSGQLAWEDGSGGVVGVRQFFKERVNEESSREPISSVETTEKAGAGSNGLGTPGSPVAVDKKFVTKVDENKLRDISPEERSQVMGRIARGEMTDGDKAFYQVEEIKQPSTVEETAQKPLATDNAAKAGPARKRDAGFNINVTCAGDLRILCRKSYILEGLSKYSGKYYLYRRHLLFGEKGFRMTLVFTK